MLSRSKVPAGMQEVYEICETGTQQHYEPIEERRVGRSEWSQAHGCGTVSYTVQGPTKAVPYDV